MKERTVQRVANTQCATLTLVRPVKSRPAPNVVSTSFVPIEADQTTIRLEPI